MKQLHKFLIVMGSNSFKEWKRTHADMQKKLHRLCKLIDYCYTGKKSRQFDVADATPRQEVASQRDRINEMTHPHHQINLERDSAMS